MMMISRFFICLAASVLLLGLPAVKVHAASPCDPVGRLVTVEGQVEVQQAPGSSWLPAQLNAELCQGDLVRAGQRSRATIQLINQSVLRLDQNTAMRLDNVTGKTEERSTLSLLKGAFQSFSRRPRGFEVNTPYLNGSIEGTEFVFRVKENESELTVLEGIVVASNSHGSVNVSGGESVTAAPGQAPQARTVVRPRDVAQWSLYYPPVMAAPAQGAGGAQASLNNAAELLSVGRVEEARAEIDSAIGQDPNAGLAYALSAVIHVVQNNNDQALADANQAVSLSPDSAAAKIALSYAQQAAFDIPGARDTLQQAVQQQPDDALAWARLAELQLMLGDRGQARESAQQAVSLDPNLSRTQITLGFSALAEFRNAEAKAAFERAIELDAADPLPHLGLGLAKISAGDLEAGRSDIEVAVGLGSNDALLRAYLGKAYFEERRAPLDSQQFDIAKQLDPNDPTAFLYDGIAKQTVNRPVEAARDMEKSIELNDNRAAYRSRLLLDKDRAARGTSLARAYQNMGFRKLGINESTRSMTIDPANASAHRFLSDTYQGTRRREISRVSELFQAQMLQDTNINPVQPSISSTNLNIITAGGPASAGFNEFTPLFERNKTQLNMSGFGGNEDTQGGEVVATTVHDNYSLSAGAFHYSTDGFRNNYDNKHRIYNIYGQAAITPTVNVQAEYRHRDTDNGDLALNFDPDDLLPNYDREFRDHSARIGMRINPNPSSNVLLSYMWSDRKDQQEDGFKDREIIPPPFEGLPEGFFEIDSSSDNEADETAKQYEAQYIFGQPGYNLTVGGSYADVEQKFTFVTNNTTTLQPPFPVDPVTNTDKSTFRDRPDIDDKRGYAYGNFTIPSPVTWTLGLSYQDYDEDAFDKSRVNPKFGVQWDVTDTLRARGAYFKAIKPALASNRSLEPTQVAGFNQYFDDSNGTKSTRFGGALDWRTTQTLSMGVEATRRKMDTPEFVQTGNSVSAKFDEQDEWLHRIYAYWMPADHWSFSAEAVYDKYESDKPVDFDQPEEVKTISFPLTVQYFHPAGFFGGVGVTYVDQDVDRSNLSTLSDGDDSFTVADMSVGYRLPRRSGIVSLSLQNMFDKEFDYQDDSFREFQDEPSVGPYIPDRSVLARVSLNF